MSECLFLVWFKICVGVRGQNTFMCVVKWGREGSACLFCVWYKTCDGVRGQSFCFVCGIIYVL